MSKARFKPTSPKKFKNDTLWSKLLTTDHRAVSIYTMINWCVSMLRLSRVASNKERVQLCQSSFDATSIYQTKLVGFPGLLGTYVSLLFVFKRKSEDIAAVQSLAVFKRILPTLVSGLKVDGKLSAINWAALGSGCGTVVSSGPRGPDFESSHQHFFGK